MNLTFDQLCLLMGVLNAAEVVPEKRAELERVRQAVAAELLNEQEIA